jgi:pyruvate dehydrogenase E2 component (dihydrolipoamide acetyltransferase)
MPVPIIMPKFNNLQEESLIAEWLVKEGEAVREGDPICEVETDKVNMEVEAPQDGVLTGIRFAIGDTVPVTEIIAYLLLPGETPADLSEMEAAVAERPVSPESEPEALGPETAGPFRPKISPLARRVAEANAVNVQQIQGSGPHGRILRRDVEGEAQGGAGAVRATPAARHLARSYGIELGEVDGSGPRGRVQQADVESVPRAVPPPPVPLPPVPPPPTPEVVELSKMRRTIAAHMTASVQTAPHIFVETLVNAGRLDDLRLGLRAQGERLTVTAVIAKACALALMKHPRLNATHEDDCLLLWPAANIGIAVALEDGLVVPVIQGAEAKTLSHIQSELDDLTGRGRSNRLTGHDIENGTFTISNLGMLGVTRFTAIINQPQVAILAVGAAEKRFLPDENEQPILRSLMTLTLSVDHRFVDGADAARFLADLKRVLEEPALLAW